MTETDKIRKALRKKSSKKKASDLQWFFKTGPGEYAEGDIFIGVMVPQIRKIAREFRHIPLTGILSLLRSKIHEERLLALLMLVNRYQLSDEARKKETFNLYLKSTEFINNWDLVDLSAPRIVGSHLLNRPKAILYRLSSSSSLWERRISIIATAYFIRAGVFTYTLELASRLIADGHDLIHKAVGWMLREVGKKDVSVLEAFLRKNYKRMPRTMLRYAIEKFPEPKRKRYLNGIM